MLQPPNNKSPTMMIFEQIYDPLTTLESDVHSYSIIPTQFSIVKPLTNQIPEQRQLTWSNDLEVSRDMG